MVCDNLAAHKRLRDFILNTNDGPKRPENSSNGYGTVPLSGAKWNNLAEPELYSKNRSENVAFTV